MSTTQKNFDSSLRFLASTQRFNPNNYFNTLEKIRNRQSQFQTQKQNTIKKSSQEPYKDIFVIDSNRRFKIKLSNISNRPVVPKMNEEYLKFADFLKTSKDKQREMHDRVLSIENEKLSKRFYTKKPGEFNVKILEKINSETHDKYLQILRNHSLLKQKWLNSPLILPKISSQKKGMSNFRSKTEINLGPESSSLNNSSDFKDHGYNEISHQKSGNIEGQHCNQ